MARLGLWGWLVLALWMGAFMGLPARASAQLPDAPAPPPGAQPAEQPESAPPSTAEPSEGDAGAQPAPAPAPPPSYEPTPPPPGPAPGGYVQPPAGYGEPQAAGGQAPLRIPTRIAARLRTLETDLNLLAARGGGRIADGVISLIAGGAFFTVAFFIEDKLFRSLLFMTSGVAIGRGVIDLAVIPDAEDYAIAYSHMPMTSVEQVRDRLGYGEDSLLKLAKRNRIARMLDGSIAIASGSTTIAVFVAKPPGCGGVPDCKFKDDPINYVIIVGGGISIIGGLVSLIAKSEAERRWNAYDKLRDRLRAESERKGTKSEVQLSLPSVSPLRGGAAVTWGMRF